MPTIRGAKKTTFIPDVRDFSTWSTVNFDGPSFAEAVKAFGNSVEELNKVMLDGLRPAVVSFSTAVREIGLVLLEEQQRQKAEQLLPQVKNFGRRNLTILKKRG